MTDHIDRDRERRRALGEDLSVSAPRPHARARSRDAEARRAISRPPPATAGITRTRSTRTSIRLVMAEPSGITSSCAMLLRRGRAKAADDVGDSAYRRTPTSPSLTSISSATRPRCELPASSSPGDHTAMDAVPGAIARYAAADAALARQSDAIGEFARAVIVAAHQHQRVDASCAFGRHHAAAGRGIAPEMREEAPRHRQLLARHRDRAVVEIDAERESTGFSITPKDFM